MSSRSWDSVLGVALLVALTGACGDAVAPGKTEVAPSALPSAAPNAGKGDSVPTPATEVDLAGTVEEIVGASGRRHRPLKIRLAVAGAQHSVRLAPAAFLAEQGFDLAVGDALRVVGVGRTRRGKEIVVARSIARGEASLELRDADGRPLWSRAAESPDDNREEAAAGDNEDR